MANMSFTNNAATTLASGITNVATSLTVASSTGLLFPTLSGSQYFYCTLGNNAGTVEIVKVTARSTDTFTIVRAQDNTSAVAWNLGDKCELRLVAASLNDFPKLDEVNAFAADNSFVSQNGGQLAGLRNRIINGDMRIDQRYAGASVTPTVPGWSVDRWAVGLSVTSKYSIQQNAGAVTPPTGFSKYLGCTSLSAYAVLAGDYFFISQTIEGNNLVDLAWGTASAKTVTLSFWVRSSLTGTFGGSARNYPGVRSYPFNYVINSANTWEQKTITIPGDTTGTWVTDATGGPIISWSIGAGTTYSGTAGAWVGSNLVSTTGATSVVGTNTATFYITGVQFEVGSVATPFEQRPYGMELSLCQRYAFNVVGCFAGYTNGTTAVDTAIQFPVTMRAAPTALASGVNAVATAIPASGATPAQTGLNFTIINIATPQGLSARFGSFVGLTASTVAYVYTPAAGSGFLSAEL